MPLAMLLVVRFVEHHAESCCLEYCSTMTSGHHVHVWSSMSFRMSFVECNRYIFNLHGLCSYYSNFGRIK